MTQAFGNGIFTTPTPLPKGTVHDPATPTDAPRPTVTQPRAQHAGSLCARRGKVCPVLSQVTGATERGGGAIIPGVPRGREARGHGSVRSGAVRSPVPVQRNPETKGSPGRHSSSENRAEVATGPGHGRNRSVPCGRSQSEA